VAFWTTPILDEMAQHRGRFEAFCRSLTPEELATPVPDAPWTVHGYIAHLCTIDALLNRFFGPVAGMTDMPAPEVPPPAPFDIDEWNEAIVARRPDVSLDDLFAEAAASRANYERILRVIPEPAAGMMVPFGGDRKKVDLPPTTVRLQDLLSTIALHDPNHTHDIVWALPHREPEVHDWLVSADYRARSHPEILARRA
jgi:hypothetical protein